MTIVKTNSICKKSAANPSRFSYYECGYDYECVSIDRTVCAIILAC